MRSPVWTNASTGTPACSTRLPSVRSSAAEIRMRAVYQASPVCGLMLKLAAIVWTSPIISGVVR